MNTNVDKDTMSNGMIPTFKHSEFCIATNSSDATMNDDIDNSIQSSFERSTSKVFDTLKDKITKEQLFKALENGMFPISEKDTAKDYLFLKNEYQDDVNIIMNVLAQLKTDISLLENLLSPFLLKNKNEFTSKLIINYDNYLAQLMESFLNILDSTEDLRSKVNTLKNQITELPQYSNASANKYYSESKLVSLLHKVMDN